MTKNETKKEEIKIENKEPTISEKKIIEKRIKLTDKTDIDIVNKILYFQSHVKALNELLIERKNVIDNAINQILTKYDLPLNSSLSCDTKTQELVIQYNEKQEEKK